MRKNEQSSGYRGEALEILKKANAGIGDKIRLRQKDETLEGILIPVSEYSDGKHVVMKLKSGYNIGVRIAEDTKIEKTGEGTKPAFTTSELPTQDKKLPKVAIISTGGTIRSEEH